MTEPTPELKTYHGNCHCGAFKFTVKLPEISSVGDCNCSICFRKGYVWVFPGAGCFTIEKGEGTLKDYEFAGKTIAHQFCPTCGTGVVGKRHGQPSGMDIGINARTIRGLDLWSLKTATYDGKALEPAYSPHSFKGTEPTAEIENAKIYYGSCHCGNVTLELKTKGPLNEGHEYIQECNCSICTRNGTILTYPSSTQVSLHSTTPTTPYIFGRAMQSHEFCPICGVSIYIRRLSVTPEHFAKYSKRDQKAWEGYMPINLRCFEGVEWDKIEVKKGDYKDVEPQYEV
ncbi:hypothetical protein N431DRAFT_497541 [Stipitochalara longipes BDJ]|nr:hypothetical protein N431DRAFT_497541 [Stipitochalara longipes BDJ]